VGKEMRKADRDVSVLVELAIWWGRQRCHSRHEWIRKKCPFSREKGNTGWCDTADVFWKV
jgi:hypothetical protein